MQQNGTDHGACCVYHPGKYAHIDWGVLFDFVLTDVQTTGGYWHNWHFCAPSSSENWPKLTGRTDNKAPQITWQIRGN